MLFRLWAIMSHRYAWCCLNTTSSGEFWLLWFPATTTGLSCNKLAERAQTPACIPAILKEQNFCSWQDAIYWGVLLFQCPCWNQLAEGSPTLHFVLPFLHRLCEENSFLLESVSAIQHALWSVFCPHHHPRWLQASLWDYLSGMQSPRYIIFKVTLWECGKAAGFFPYRRGTGLKEYLDQAKSSGAPNSS